MSKAFQRTRDRLLPSAAVASRSPRVLGSRATTLTVRSTEPFNTLQASLHALPTSEYPPSSAYAFYGTATAPTSAQLQYADQYFRASNPTFLLGGAQFRTLPPSYVPEVAFVGRSNVGKSSLLNALLHRSSQKLARISSRPGRTKEMNAFGVHGVDWISGSERQDGKIPHPVWAGRGGLVVLDMPGYGKASRESWGKEIVKYLVGRRQLRRTFVLVDGEHGVKKSDMQMLEVLRDHGIAHQVVLAKIDKVLLPRGRGSIRALKQNLDDLPRIFERAQQKISENTRAGLNASKDIITCSSEVDIPPGSGKKIGIDNLRWAILSAAGLDCDSSGNVRSIEFQMQEESMFEGTS